MDPSSYKNLVDSSSATTAAVKIKADPSPSSPTTAPNNNSNDKPKTDDVKIKPETKGGFKIPPHIPQSALPLTREELALLKMYETIKSYEKTADLARSAAAKAILDAADKKHKLEKMQRHDEEDADDDDRDDNDPPVDDDGTGDVKVEPQQQQRHKKPGTAKKRRSHSDDDMSAASAHSRSSGDGSSSDSDSNNNKRRRVKNDVDMKAEEEEEERARLADEGSGSDNDDQPLLVKKQRKDDGYDSDDRPTGSLIKNLEKTMDTPPHDLSRKLKMSKITGTQLFPDMENVQRKELSWNPPDGAGGPEDGCMELRLDKFNAAQAAVGSGNNTVAIKFVAPTESRRFSINIASPKHNGYDSILFHFNPRQFEKGGQLVINNKEEGMWGQGLNVPLSSVPLMFGQKSSTLIVQITGDGFDIFLEGQHCARLEHRIPLPTKAKRLVLQFPSTDDSRKRENWTVFKVWWGHKDLMAKDLSNVPGVNTHHQLHAKKLFVSGLSKIRTEPQVDLRRAELERAFRKYGGALGITATVPTNSTFAFVEVETERMADLALAEMAGRYRLNRARRSKQEALMEKRAAAEAAGMGGGREE